MSNSQHESRAYSRLDVKGLQKDDPDHWIIEGIASTPTPDRMGDSVDPMGAQFKTPMPLLWQHDSKQPVGVVEFAKPTKSGIPFRARLPKVQTPGKLKDRIDEAVQSVAHGLVAWTSIGFRGLDVDELKDAKGARTGGLLFKVWEWLELSLVTIPANPQASINFIKSLDLEQRAASGRELREVVRLGASPGVSGTTGRSGHTTPRNQGQEPMKTVQEQISDWKAKLQATRDRQNALMAKANDEGRTLDEAEAEEHDGLEPEIKGIESHLARLEKMGQQIVVGATAVSGKAATAADAGAQSRSGGVISVRRNTIPGAAFTRYAMVLAQAKGNLMQAEVLARRFDDTTPEVSLAIKAAVAAGTTQDTTWAAPLVQLQEMQSEFIEFLRPMTLLGRIPGLRRVPFNIKFTRQTAGTTGTFVGEGLPKPLGKMDFELLSLTWAKAATIIVMTEELVRFSTPSAEALARDDLAAGIAQYLDKRFIDPSYAGVANVSPASITNGVTPISSSGTTVAAIDADITTALTAMSNANLNLGGLVWIMNPAKALKLAMKRNTDGTRSYPDVSISGGTLYGYPVIVSNNVSLVGSPTDSFAVLLDPSEIMVADDGGVTIDMSTEASVQMSDTPTGGATSLVSLWQANLVGLRAERFINWRKRRDNAVQVIQNVDW